MYKVKFYDTKGRLAGVEHNKDKVKIEKYFNNLKDISLEILAKKLHLCTGVDLDRAILIDNSSVGVFKEYHF